MPRENLNDLVAFLAVAKERSFTKAAAQVGVSQSALSHTIRGLEERLGLRLLTRTTRSVAPTEAGERLLRAAGPRLDEIEAELAALSELRDKPSGTIRITAHDHAVRAVLWPALARLLPDYPDIKVEIVIDYGLRDIVAERYDAGVRTGEMVAKDTAWAPTNTCPTPNPMAKRNSRDHHRLVVPSIRDINARAPAIHTRPKVMSRRGPRTRNSNRLASWAPTITPMAAANELSPEASGLMPRPS